MHDFCAAYVDDILIYGGTWKEHVKHLGEVLKVLEQAGLTVMKMKCEWARAVLDHEIGGGRVAIHEDRVTAMRSYKRPTAKKEIRAFLGNHGLL